MKDKWIDIFITLIFATITFVILMIFIVVIAGIIYLIQIL